MALEAVFANPAAPAGMDADQFNQLLALQRLAQQQNNQQAQVGALQQQNFLNAMQGNANRAQNDFQFGVGAREAEQQDIRHLMNAALDREAMYGNYTMDRNANLANDQMSRNQMYQNNAADRQLKGDLGMNALNMQYGFEDSALNRTLAKQVGDRNAQMQFGYDSLNASNAMADQFNLRGYNDASQQRSLEALLGMTGMNQQTAVASRGQDMDYTLGGRGQDLQAQMHNQNIMLGDKGMNLDYLNSGYDRQLTQNLANQQTNLTDVMNQRQYTNAGLDRDALYGFKNAELMQNTGLAQEQMGREYGYRNDALDRQYDWNYDKLNFMGNMIPGVLGQVGGMVGGMGGGASGGMSGFQDIGTGQFSALPGASPPLGGAGGAPGFATTQGPITAQAPTQGAIQGAAQNLGQMGTPTMPNTPFQMSPGAGAELAGIGSAANNMANTTAQMDMQTGLMPAQAQLGQSINQMRGNLALGQMQQMGNLRGDQLNQAAGYIMPALNLIGSIG